MAPEVDPEIAAALEKLPEPELELEAMRRAHLEGTEVVSGEGPDVPHVMDHAVEGPDGHVPVRLYMPEAPGGRPPLLVYLHGGGWIMGSRASYDPTCRALAVASGVAVLSVEYRLAPEDPFPAAVDDASAALTWAAAEGHALGADPSRLAIGGDSAGANLAAVAARRARDAGGPELAFQLLIYPVVDAAHGSGTYEEFADGPGLTRETMRFCWDAYLDGADPHDPDASPLQAGDLAGLPPALVVAAEIDPLRDEGEAYARALEAAGVPVELRRVPGAVHGFWRFGAVSRLARETVASTGASLREALAYPPG
jgi:acetyl esterase